MYIFTLLTNVYTLLDPARKSKVDNTTPIKLQMYG